MSGARAPTYLLSDYSLEITASDVADLTAARSKIPAQSAVSITFLPRDNIDELANVAAAVRKLGFVPVPHISARRVKSESDLMGFLAKLRDSARVDRVFVIAGDLPSSLGPYNDALAILRTGLLAEFGIRHVGIAGYPEGHPRITADKLALAMREKLAVLADVGQTAEIITQFAFDGDDVLAWLGRLRADGIRAPVRIGLPGPVSVQSLLRFATRCGVGTSAKVLTKYGISITHLLSTATPDRLVKMLASGIDYAVHGMIGAHLYPFGGITRTAEWASSFMAKEPIVGGRGAFLK